MIGSISLDDRFNSFHERLYELARKLASIYGSRGHVPVDTKRFTGRLTPTTQSLYDYTKLR
jgi:hypothetical protein